MPARAASLRLNVRPRAAARAEHSGAQAPQAVAGAAAALLLRSCLGRSLLSETAYLSFPQPPRLVVQARPLGSRAAPERDPGGPFPADSSLHSRPAPPLRIRTYATPAAARTCVEDGPRALPAFHPCRTKRSGCGHRAAGKPAHRWHKPHLSRPSPHTPNNRNRSAARCARYTLFERLPAAGFPNSTRSKVILAKRNQTLNPLLGLGDTSIPVIILMFHAARGILVLASSALVWGAIGVRPHTAYSVGVESCEITGDLFVYGRAARRCGPP
jgi:hypothetical protein